MSDANTTRALWQIHLCVLLWGFTAILGKLITLPALPLVWWRMLLVVASLLLVPKVWRGLRAMPALRQRPAVAGPISKGATSNATRRSIRICSRTGRAARGFRSRP